ncbi:hypothetical protein LDENG_00125320, partial [Lucifuga dentata]
ARILVKHVFLQAVLILLLFLHHNRSHLPNAHLQGGQPLPLLSAVSAYSVVVVGVLIQTRRCRRFERNMPTVLLLAAETNINVYIPCQASEAKKKQWLDFIYDINVLAAVAASRLSVLTTSLMRDSTMLA